MVGPGVVGSGVELGFPVGCIVGGLVVAGGGSVGGAVVVMVTATGVHEAQLVVLLTVHCSVSLQPNIHTGRHTGMIVSGVSIDCCWYVIMT